MQGGQLIDSSHARLPCDLCCCAGECIGHAGVQMGKWSVHEVRVVQVGCMVTFAGRPQQRREQRGWNRRRRGVR